MIFGDFVFLSIIKFLLAIPLSIINFINDKKDKKNGLIPLKYRYGVVAFCGLAGSGKTMSMTYELFQIRKKYGDKVYIFTNYPCAFADAQFTSYKQLLKNFNKPVFVGWDELPNDFNKNYYKDFPIDLFTKLTQLRKGNGMKLYYTTQDISLVDIAFRRLTFYVCDCHTYKNFFTYYLEYTTEYYFNKKQSVSVDNKTKIPIERMVWFFQNKTLRSCYDSFIFLSGQNAKSPVKRDKRMR